MRRDIERILKILITEPLVHNQGISAKRHRIDR